jgi:hypothetical protein
MNQTIFTEGREGVGGLGDHAPQDTMSGLLFAQEITEETEGDGLSPLAPFAPVKWFGVFTEDREELFVPERRRATVNAFAPFCKNGLADPA